MLMTVISRGFLPARAPLPYGYTAPLSGTFNPNTPLRSVGVKVAMPTCRSFGAAPRSRALPGSRRGRSGAAPEYLRGSSEAACLGEAASEALHAQAHGAVDTPHQHVDAPDL